MRQPDCKPLSADEIGILMAKSFTPTYLNLINIIQAAALSLLCQKSAELDFNFLRALYIFMSIVMIAVVCYEYHWFVGMHRWSPRFSDTLIPLTLGFWEILAIFNLDQPRNWWLMMTAFTLTGAVAYLNTWTHCQSGMLEDLVLSRCFRSNTHKSIILALTMSAISVSGAIYGYAKPIQFRYAVDLLMAAVYLTFFILLLRKDMRFLDFVRGRVVPLQDGAMKEAATAKLTAGQEPPTSSPWTPRLRGSHLILILVACALYSRRW